MASRSKKTSSTKSARSSTGGSRAEKSPPKRTASKKPGPGRSAAGTAAAKRQRAGEAKKKTVTRGTEPKKAASGEAARKKSVAKGSAARKAAAGRTKAPGAAPGLTRKRAETLLHLEERLGERIVGKEKEIAAIARVIRISGTDLDFRPERPTGSFLLVGPEGVGKNEIAHAVGEVLFGSEEVVTSIDLTEIGSEEDLGKLGATLVPGSETQYLPGLLTEPVRENPEAVLLLRGLEQAHPSFHRLLLTILERGRVEDMLGPLSFSRTLIFVTMTLTREELAPQEIGFGRPTKSAEVRLRELLARFVLPDLLSAFNEVLELPPLSVPEVRQIARYKVDRVLRRMARHKKAIVVADSVYDELITEDLCGGGGAKFLNRTLEQRIFNPLARYLLEHRSSREIQVGIDHGSIVIEREEKTAPRPAARRVRPGGRSQR